MTARNVVVELFVNDGWADITTSTRQSVVSIVRGAPDEAQGVVPSVATLMLHDPDGTFMPRNPVSIYASQLGNFTPIRISDRLLVDAFNRTSVDSWGAINGHTYTLRGSGGPPASDWQVTPGAATHSVPANGVFRESYLPTKVVRAVRVQTTFSLPGISSVTGGPLEPGNVELRGQAPGDYYLARVVINSSDQSITVAIYRQDATLLFGPEGTFGLNYQDGHAYTVALQADRWLIQAKVWDAATPEPLSWMVGGVTDWINLKGFVGVRSGVGTGNTNAKPVSFSYSNFTVSSPRMFGEVSSWTPTHDVTNRVRSTGIQVTGPAHRMSLPNTAPSLSAPRRFIPTTFPVAYWALEDGVSSTQGEPTVAAIGTTAATSRHLSQPSMEQGWGRGQLAPWLAPTVDRRRRSSTWGGLTFSWATFGYTDDCTLDFMVNGESHSSLHVLPAGAENFVPSSASISGFKVVFDGTAQTIELHRLDTGALVTTKSAPELFDGRPHYVRWRTIQVGAHVHAFVDVDRINKIGVEVVTITLEAPGVAVLSQSDDGSQTLVHGHVAVWYGNAPFPNEAAHIAFGRPGERAGDRFIRLCSEEGLPFAWEGDLARSAPMGNQRYAPVAELLRDCADAEQGVIYEMRGSGALNFVMLRSLYNQPAALSLDYAGQQVYPPFLPVDDGQHTVNEWTVHRPDGNEFVVAQNTGPLSTANPPSGVGKRPRKLQVNAHTESQVPLIGGWLLAKSTVDDFRYPSISAHTSGLFISEGLADAILDADVADGVAVTNVSAIDIYDPVRQIIQGSTETLDTAHAQVLHFNCAPVSPYDVAVLGTDRLDSLHTTVWRTITSSSTTVTGRVALRRARWTNAAAQLPLPLRLGGEEVSATAVTDVPVTLNAVGDPVHAVNASLVVPLPAGLAAGQCLFILAAIRNSGAGEPVRPAGYLTLLDMENVGLYAKLAESGETAPTVTFTGGVAGADTSAIAWSLSGVDPLDVVGTVSSLNSSAQDIAVPAMTVSGGPITAALLLHVGWKQDDWTSVAPVADGTEIAEPDTTAGDDQGITAAYRVITTTAPFNLIEARTFTVTGGASAISRGGVIVLSPQLVTFTVTRSVNGVSKAQVAGESLRVSPSSAARLGLSR